MSDSRGKPGRPGKAVIDISAGCNTDCIFCLRNQVRSQVGLGSAPDLAKLGEFLTLCRTLGVARIELGGDEPTMLPKKLLQDVVRACARQEFAEIRLVTNGVKLGEGRFVDELVAWGVRVFLLPVYGSTPKVHDAITQRPGSFAALGRAVRALARHEGRVRVLCHLVLLRQNEKDVESTRRMVHLWGHELLVVPLHRGHSHVDFAPLIPARSLGVRERRTLTEKAGEYDVSLNYNLVSGELNFGMGHNDSMRAFVLSSFERFGMSAELRASIERSWERNPLYRRPRAFLGLWRLAERGDFGHPRMAAYLAGSATALFDLARHAMAGPDRSETAFLFDLVLAYPADDDQSRTAKEQARRHLEDTGLHASRGGKNAKAASRITHSKTK